MDGFDYGDALTPTRFFKDEELNRIMKDHPKFFAALPLQFFKEFFDAYNPFGLLKHKRLLLSDVPLINDLTQRIAALVELETNPETLKVKLLNFVKKNSDLLPEIFRNIIKYSENPARAFHKVLLALKDLKKFESFSEMINAYLKTTPYLESLLKPENEDIFEFPNEGIFINIDSDTFKLFSSFAIQMGAERIAPLLKHIVIDWKGIVCTSGLFASDFDSFFKAIGINIKKYEINQNKTVEDMLAIESIQRDSRCLLIEPKVDSKYIFEVLLQEANLAYNKDIEERESFAWKYGIESKISTNPFALSYFGVYDYIMEKNLEAFVSHVPDKVFTAFKPKIPYYLVKKTLYNAGINRTLTYRVLIQSFSPGTIHRITIASIANLKVYSTKFYPELYLFNYETFYLDVYFDWEAIINDSVIGRDFQIIMESLNQKEFEDKILTLNPTPKIKEFISIYYQKRDSIPFKQIAKKYLDAFIP